MLETAVARMPVRKLSSDFGRRDDRSVLTVLANYRVIFSGWLLITVAATAIGCRSVRINKAAIVFATAVADLRLRFTVPVNWNQVLEWENRDPTIGTWIYKIVWPIDRRIDQSITRSTICTVTMRSIDRLAVERLISQELLNRFNKNVVLFDRLKSFDYQSDNH